MSLHDDLIDNDFVKQMNENIDENLEKSLKKDENLEDLNGAELNIDKAVNNEEEVINSDIIDEKLTVSDENELKNDEKSIQIKESIDFIEKSINSSEEESLKIRVENDENILTTEINIEKLVEKVEDIDLLEKESIKDENQQIIDNNIDNCEINHLNRNCLENEIITNLEEQDGNIKEEIIIKDYKEESINLDGELQLNNTSDKIDDDNKSDLNLLNIETVNNDDSKSSKIHSLDENDASSHIIETKDEFLDANDPDNFVDILGNKLLTKRILKKGLGRETRPSHGDSVIIRYQAWNSRGEMFIEEMEEFVLGDGDMIQAFDLALCLAEKDEEFELITDARFAYGVQGLLPDVQPNESLKFKVKLLSVDDAPDYGTYSAEDRISAADKKRERGNFLYRREEFSYAVNSYSRAIKIIESDPEFRKSFKEPSKEILFDLFIKVTNNLAASQLKLESADNVIETCNTILNYDPDNVKALFRKGKGLSMKGSFDEAIAVLKRALELDNTNKLIATEIQKCIKHKRAEDEQRARICRRMFGGDSKTESAAATKTAAGDSSSKGEWRRVFCRYLPYVGAGVVTVLSIFITTMAISKSKAT